MELKKENIEQIVQYINIELKKNPKASVNKICDKVGIKQSTFKTWVHKANYSFNVGERQYTKGTQKDADNEIDMDKLNELIKLLEPLKELIAEHNKSITKVSEVELNPPSITNVKQKLFKIDVDILNDWEQFVQDHKQYKIQNLISLALKEFIEKYK